MANVSKEWNEISSQDQLWRTAIPSGQMNSGDIKQRYAKQERKGSREKNYIENIEYINILFIFCAFCLLH